MSSKALREMIDRMVEESIRRILPSVLNEVLVRTIANSGVIREERSPQQLARRLQPQRPQARPPARKAPRAGRRPDLSELLDESAGADFYRDPRALMTETPAPDSYEPEEEEAEERRPALESRIASLPPELRGLAEDIDLDDGGEMWGDDEHAPMLESSDPMPIRDVSRAANAVGVDFSRMKNVIAATSPKRTDRSEAAEDAKARAEFERNRIARMREMLGATKPGG